MNRHSSLRALTLAIVFLVVQLAAGCRWEACLGFSIALFFGWCACEAAGSWRSLLGLLTISLYTKVVLFGCVAKTLLVQPMDEGVRAPAETAVVFALGFAAVWLAVLLQRLLPLPAHPLARRPEDPRSSLVLWASFLVLGGVSWLLIFLLRLDLIGKSDPEWSVVAGRIYQVPGQLVQLFPFVPAAAVFYISQRGGRKLISHPLVIISLLVSAVPGVLEASKQGVMNPVAALWISVLLLRGPRYKPLWLLTGASLIIFIGVVYPLVQASRGAVRRGTLQERLSAINNVSRGLASAESGAIFDEMIDREVVEPYLPRAVAPLDRFVRYIEASRLIEATVNDGVYTGFFTLVWGLQLIPPRMLSPNKPLSSPNNWLGQYTGDIHSDDEISNCAYGFMASFFNAFGYWGAFFGSFLLYGLMTYWLRLFVEDRAGPNIWVLTLFLLFDLHLVEDSAGGLMYSVWIPLPVLLYSLGLAWISSRILRGPAHVSGAARWRRSVQMSDSTAPRETT
jgi:hypothetical protein